MKKKFVIISYFLYLAIFILLLRSGCLLSVVQLTQLIIEVKSHLWMSHLAHQKPVAWNTFSGNRYDGIPQFKCPWGITSNNEGITVNITYINWFFKYNFWILLKIHPQGNPDIPLIMAIDGPNPLFRSITKTFLQFLRLPYLNDCKFQVYGELKDHLYYKVN